MRLVDRELPSLTVFRDVDAIAVIRCLRESELRARDRAGAFEIDLPPRITLTGRSLPERSGVAVIGKAGGVIGRRARSARRIRMPKRISSFAEAESRTKRV